MSKVIGLGYVIVLRRISDYSYIKAPLKSPFTTRWGYGGRFLDLKPPASSRWMSEVKNKEDNTKNKLKLNLYDKNNK